MHIFTQGYDWHVEAYLDTPEDYRGHLSGDTRITFDPQTARAVFSDLSIDAHGVQYILDIYVVTHPGAYHFTIQVMYK